MNLKNDQNILLAKKAVYAEQLLYYSRLCQTYQALAEEARKRRISSPYDIEKRYAEPLSKIISSSNINVTLDNLEKEHVFSEDYMGAKYSPKELEFFRSFGRNSEIFKNFQNASSFLDRAYTAENDSERETAISNFHSYLSNPNRSKKVRNFDKLISEHSPRYIGHRYFLVANKGLNDINEVDSDHIPLSPFVIKENLSPERFGAIISGYKSLAYKIDELEFGQASADSFDPDNWDLLNNREQKVLEAEDSFQSISHSVSEKAFVVGSKIKNPVSKAYKAHKGTIKKAAAIAAAVALLIGGVYQASKELAAHNLDMNQSQYEQTITNETKDYIERIMADLNLQRDSFDPQYQDVKAIEENIDLVLDYVVRDQVTTAFQAYHKGWTVTNVESWFDKSLQPASPNSEPREFEFITVSYIDENGNSGKEDIGDFRSDFITKNHLQDIFSVEENIDLNSPIYSAFNNDGTKNFLDKADDIEDVMQYLGNIISVTKHAAAFKVEHGHGILGKPFLKSELPDKVEQDEER